MDQDSVQETPVRDSFNALLVRWVSHKLDKPIKAAHLGTDLSYPNRDSGCDTCGWGADTLSFDIWYYLPGETRGRYFTVEENPLDWLAYTLFGWEESHAE